MKKGSANMWWIIIGAVIALVVVIVLLVIFTGRTSNLEDGLGDCRSKGGICVSGYDCPSNTLSTSTFTCSNQGTCCVGIPKDESECPNNPKGYIPSTDPAGKSWCR